jgi:cytochrome c556
MRKYSIKPALALTTLAAVLLSPLAVSHFDDKAIPQSYRQSYFTLVALNFGPMAAMVKGDIPWNQTGFEDYANDLATVTSLDFARGWPEGSHTGKTRAKPEIWENKADFESKFEDLRTAVASLQKSAAGGDRAAIVESFKATGGACKACHDDYKSKDYLN